MSANTTQRKVRFGDDKSSRSSTLGGSSTSSSHSGRSFPDEYTDARYNIAALQDSLTRTVQQLDASRDEAHKYKEEASSAKARVSALENFIATLKNDVKELQQQLESSQEDNDKLKKKNESLKKKLRDQESQSEGPSSPDSAKPRRSGSKKSKQSDADDIDRLKERFDRSSTTGSSTSGSTHSKPPSSSKATVSRHRRASVSSSSTERPAPYVEAYGSSKPRAMPPSPVSPTSSRRVSQYPSGADYYVPHMQDPMYSRNIDMQRGSVVVPLYEDGNYHLHPLPDQRRQY